MGAAEQCKSCLVSLEQNRELGAERRRREEGVGRRRTEPGTPAPPAGRPYASRTKEDGGNGGAGRSEEDGGEYLWGLSGWRRGVVGAGGVGGGLRQRVAGAGAGGGLRRLPTLADAVALLLMRERAESG